MYQIPENYNIDGLKGEIIFQIAFGLNFITFFFSKGYIQLEGSFSTVFEDQIHEFEEVFPAKHDFGLLILLEQKITEVNVKEDRSVLVLSFENGFTLKLIGNDRYESFGIKINEEEIII